MSKADTQQLGAAVLISQILQCFVDSFTFMLVMGAISHVTGIKQLAFSFMLSLLIKIASACLIPQETTSNIYLSKLVEKA